MKTSEQATSFSQYITEKISHYGFELLVFLGAFFAPVAPMLMAVGAAILLDTYFGRWRARKDKDEAKREEVTSKKTRVGLVEKAKWYILIVVGVFILDYAAINEFMVGFFGIPYAVTKVMTIVFCWIEYTSINESFKAVKGKSIGDALRELLRSAKNTKKDINEIKK